MSRHIFTIFLFVAAVLTIGLVVMSYSMGKSIKSLEVSLTKMDEGIVEVEKLLSEIEEADSPYTGIGIQIQFRSLAGSGNMMASIVGDIMCSGPAHKAGIKQGDEISRFNRQSIYFPDTPEGYIKYMQVIASVTSSKPGALIPIEVWRKNKDGTAIYIKLSVPVAEIPSRSEWKTDCSK